MTTLPRKPCYRRGYRLPRDAVVNFDTYPNPIPPEFLGCSRWTRSPKLGQPEPKPYANHPWKYCRSISTCV